MASGLSAANESEWAIHAYRQPGQSLFDMSSLTMPVTKELVRKPGTDRHFGSVKDFKEYTRQEKHRGGRNIFKSDTKKPATTTAAAAAAAAASNKQGA